MTPYDRKRLVWAIIVPAILGIAAVPLCLVFVSDTSQVYDNPRFVEIPPGATTQTVAQILAEKGLLKHPTLFVICARITGRDKKLRAGRFRIDHSMSVWELLRHLTRGGSFDVRVTVPEGFTIFKIAGLVQRELGIDSLEFLRACRDTQLLRRLKIPGPTAEGYLFPETYYFPQGISADSVISTMYAEFKKHWKPEYSARAESLGMSINEVITLASIIEAEAHEKFEQPIISSVYHNRLAKGMKLQADPTTIYGLRKFDRPLSLKDLEDTSAYNTYRYFGLPPGPICNPGDSAIYYALYPDSTDYLYFVSRRDGTHIFSRTLKEHHRAIHSVKKLLRRNKTGS